MMRKIWLLIITLLSGVFGKCVFAREFADDHRRLAIYQIMVASFQHGDGGAEGYSQMWGPDGHRKNGNLRGIIGALDHIQSLGVNAIWLTPVFDSSKASGGEKLQATGYFTNDYFSIDPHFGTEAEFCELVDEAHKRGLYVILDGVFGHHGGVSAASPGGHRIDCTVTESDRVNGGTGNVSYPGSLEYFKEVATYWIDRYGIDGWRLDQAYQACQGGHNYWKEIRGVVEDLCSRRKAEGHRWGTLGYMVGEDWGEASGINGRVYRDGGLMSAFDFDGKELISGPMQNLDDEGLANGWDDIVRIYSSPSVRGYLNDEVMPNLFLSNHDGYRLADHFDEENDLYFYEKIMTRFAILAGYPGPITLYYGDEYADLSKYTHGAQPDNIARTSGHIDARDEREQELKDYVSMLMEMRSDNPAMWRGKSSFERIKEGSSDVLIVTKSDKDSGNAVVMVFSDADAVVPVCGIDHPLDVKAWVPVVIKLK